MFSAKRDPNEALSPDAAPSPDAVPSANAAPSPSIDRLGRPLRDLRISVIDECNFRCTYCMPKELFAEGHPFLPPNALLTFDEIERLVRVATGLGVNKVKITGGEPLLRPAVHTLVGRLSSIPGIDDVGLITNGYHLPRLAGWLTAAGLKRITISLDSINTDTFSRIADRATGLEQVIAGIDRARECGFSPIKVNMVVQRGVNSDEVVEMAEFARGRGLELRYIEYMDVGHRHDFDESLVVPNREIRDFLHRRFGLAPLDPDHYGEVADTYEYSDGGGRVGFISSMTVPFCGSCTRLRLSADGKLYRCLFSGLGLDVRRILRAGGERAAGGQREQAGDAPSADEVDSELARAMRRFWGDREDRYSELRDSGDAPHDNSREGRIEMYRMGG